MLRHRLGKVGKQRRARGSALAEFAVISPLLITILLGIVEFGYLYMLRQTMTNAAREGCRLGIIDSSTEAMVLARVQEMMNATGVTIYSVNYVKGTEEDPVDSLDITVNYADVTLLPGFFSSYVGDITTACSMRQEGT